MILHITFRVCERDAKKVIERVNIKSSNEPRCLDSQVNKSTWVIYTAKSNHLRWRCVKEVGRIINALTKEVYYEDMLPQI